MGPDSTCALTRRFRDKLDEAGLEIVDWRSAYIIPNDPRACFSGRKFYRIDRAEPVPGQDISLSE